MLADEFLRVDRLVTPDERAHDAHRRLCRGPGGETDVVHRE